MLWTHRQIVECVRLESRSTGDSAHSPYARQCVATLMLALRAATAASKQGIESPVRAVRPERPNLLLPRSGRRCVLLNLEKLLGNSVLRPKSRLNIASLPVEFFKRKLGDFCFLYYGHLVQ